MSAEQAVEHQESRHLVSAGYMRATFERSKSALPSRKSSAMTQPIENMSCSIHSWSGVASFTLSSQQQQVCWGQDCAYHLRLELLRSGLLRVAAGALVEALGRDVAAPAAPSVEEEGEVGLHTVTCLSIGCWRLGAERT